MWASWVSSCPGSAPTTGLIHYHVGIPTAVMASFMLPLLELGGCQSHQLSKPLTWTKPHSTNAAPHPSAMASLHLTGGSSQDTGVVTAVCYCGVSL